MVDGLDLGGEKMIEKVVDVGKKPIDAIPSSINYKVKRTVHESKKIEWKWNGEFLKIVIK